METVRIDADISGAVARSAEILVADGVILFPTDTLYALGADAFSNEAVDKVYAIKGRDEGKPIHVLVADIEMAETYAEVNDSVRLLVERLPKGKVTFICKKKAGFDTGIRRGIETIGFRIPDNAFCLAMLHAFCKPVTATSANKAGEQPQRTADAIIEQLGDAASGIALVVDGGELPKSEPSTVVDFTQSPPQILREGAVPRDVVLGALR